MPRAIRTAASFAGVPDLCPTNCNARAGREVSNIPYGFPGRIGLTFQRSKAFPAPCDLMPFIQASERLRRASAILVALASLATGPALAEGFKFGQPDESDRIEQEDREARIGAQLSTPCRAGIKDKKIMVVIGERQSNGVIAAQQQNYGRHFQAINSRLRALGLRTFTPEEIRRQVAQAEIDAYFRNDPDAALAASKRLGANFVLRGLISSQATRNPMMAVNQVSINMGFTLTGSNERVISNVSSEEHTS